MRQLAHASLCEGKQSRRKADGVAQNSLAITPNLWLPIEDSFLSLEGVRPPQHALCHVINKVDNDLLNINPEAYKERVEPRKLMSNQGVYFVPRILALVCSQRRFLR
jgi:hypothetical protein